jgi:hypothetical protein
MVGHLEVPYPHPKGISTRNTRYRQTETELRFVSKVCLLLVVFSHVVRE